MQNQDILLEVTTDLSFLREFDIKPIKTVFGFTSEYFIYENGLIMGQLNPNYNQFDSGNVTINFSHLDLNNQNINLEWLMNFFDKLNMGQLKYEFSIDEYDVLVLDYKDYKLTDLLNDDFSPKSFEKSSFIIEKLV
ncbi:MAG: hypothetical protein JXQ87_13875 [Bacteroidia bacterium]